MRHRVADFAAFKPVDDEADALRRAGGVRDHALMRTADDPDLVVVVHAFDDIGAAKAFMQPGLREAMDSAGGGHRFALDRVPRRGRGAAAVGGWGFWRDRP